MSSLGTNESNRRYLSIVEGSLREAVPEGTPKAVKRDWEAGGRTGTKWELVYDHIVGTITNVTFFDGEADGKKFTNLNVVFDANSEGVEPVISIGVSTRYAQDLLKKIPSLDLKEEVRIRPYSFKPDGEEKNVTGVEVTQRHPVSGNFEKKITSFFHEKKGEKWEAKNGYPNPEGDTSSYDSDDWDTFYKQVKKFLVNYTKENISTKFQEEVKVEQPKEAINPEDIPF